jgi:hypothetical protein
MKHYQGNQKVEPGLYFNLRQLSFKSIEEKGPLPGAEEDVYRRVPVAALLVAGPVLGLAFVVFLPFVGFALLGWLVAGKAAAWLADAGLAFGRVIRPAWRPAAAFLSRAKHAKHAKHAKPTRRERDRWIESVKQNLDETTRDDEDSDTLH